MARNVASQAPSCTQEIRVSSSRSKSWPFGTWEELLSSQLPLAHGPREVDLTRADFTSVPSLFSQTFCPGLTGSTSTYVSGPALSFLATTCLMSTGPPLTAGGHWPIALCHHRWEEGRKRMHTLPLRQRESTAPPSRQLCLFAERGVFVGDHKIL